MGFHNGPKAGLGGIVEADETFVGGKPRKKFRGKGKGKRGPRTGADAKVPVFGIVERDGPARMRVVEKVDWWSLRNQINEHMEPGAIL